MTNPATKLPETKAVVINQAPVANPKLNAGRIATYIGAAGALAAALAPAVANLDLTSTAGLAAGAVALAAVIIKWLDGWQKYEQDVRDPTKFNQPQP